MAEIYKDAKKMAEDIKNAPEAEKNECIDLLVGMNCMETDFVKKDMGRLALNVMVSTVMMMLENKTEKQ